MSTNLPSYQIAIPTYERYQTISQKTLQVLENSTVPYSWIYLFVANQSQYELYKQHIDSKWHSQLVIGQLGLKNQRNFITNYFQEGDWIVEMDDDLRSVKQMIIDNQTKQLQPIHDLHQAILHAFSICEKHNLRLWGVYPIHNAFFMTRKYSIDLRLLVGPMWGKINNQSLLLTIDEKEDTERTILYYIEDGGVIRLNYFTIDTTYYKTVGGMQAEQKDRKYEAYQSALDLISRYPYLGSLSIKKKSKHPECKLKDQTEKRPLKKRLFDNSTIF